MAYELVKSTLQPIWREVDPGDLAPAAVKPGMVTDAIAQKLVACAKKRFDLLQPNPPAVDYTNLILNQPAQLRGLCYIAADEFEQYFKGQGIDAKAVRVQPKGGGPDHYFTVVNEGNAKKSLIVDGTWRQFPAEGHQLRYCLIGTLEVVGKALEAAQPGDDLAGMYAAGLTVLKHWKSYSCFP